MKKEDDDSEEEDCKIKTEEDWEIKNNWNVDNYLLVYGEDS